MGYSAEAFRRQALRWQIQDRRNRVRALLREVAVVVTVFVLLFSLAGLGQCRAGNA